MIDWARSKNRYSVAGNDSICKSTLGWQNNWLKPKKTLMAVPTMARGLSDDLNCFTFFPSVPVYSTSRQLARCGSPWKRKPKAFNLWACDHSINSCIGFSARGRSISICLLFFTLCLAHDKKFSYYNVCLKTMLHNFICKMLARYTVRSAQAKGR